MNNNASNSYIENYYSDKGDYIDYSYDEELKKIEFLKLHESFLPYVGKEYRNAQFKILHVADCPYIEASQDPDNHYNFAFYRDKWFKEEIPVFPEIYDLKRQMSECVREWNGFPLSSTCENAWNEYCLNTRNVVFEQLVGKRNPYNLVGKFGTYRLYRDVNNMLNRILGKYCGESNKTINNINSNNMEAYKFVAFTDFHMFPVIVNEKNTSVEASLKKCANRREAEDFYEKIKIESSMILDKIVDVLKPDMVFITSKSAGEKYKNNTRFNDEFKDQRIFVTFHPNYFATREQRKEEENKFSRKVEELRQVPKKY